MHLVIIGGKSAEKVSEVVTRNFDNMEVSVYANVSVFAEETAARSVYIDRIILLQDAFSSAELDLVSKLTRVNEYVSKWYPEARFVVLAKDINFIKVSSEVMISPYVVSLHVEKVKSQLLLDVASLPVGALKEKYGEQSVSVPVEGIREVVPMPVVEPSKDVSKPVEKKGFLSLFSRKKKEVAVVVKQPSAVVAPKRVESPSLKTVDDGIFESENLGELASVDFSVFESDGSTDLGLGSKFAMRQPSVPSEESSVVPEEVVKPKQLTGVDISVDNSVGTTLEELSSGDTEKYINPRQSVQSPVSTVVLDTNMSVMNKTQLPKSAIVVEDVSDDLSIYFKDLDKLENAFNEKNVQVVERVVEKVVTVNVGAKAYKNGIRLIVVTGDRKTGVTRTALNLASIYSKQGSTLYVDFDTKRRGSLIYLGVAELAEEEEHVQNGLGYLKSLSALSNVCYRNEKLNFDCLVSMYTTVVPDEQVSLVQLLLATQRKYKSVVVDCPLENLHLLEDMLLYSEIIVCCESSLAGVTNTVLAFSGMSENIKFLTLLLKHSRFLVYKGKDTKSFEAILRHVVGIFGLDEENFNWGDIPVIGTSAELPRVAEGL